MTKEETNNLILKWDAKEGIFVPISSDNQMNEGIFIELIKGENKWRYFYIKGASLIARRTSLRAANGIAKTGFVHPQTNIRYGSGCKLDEEVSPYEDMPAELKKSQRHWYDPRYKKKK
ncbi:MAG: hypothetical protein GF317_00410 [Candidatus Lokiarchaeota archaeon]|nr:hypothetical protein [Candidatus Lokiarchaeota archaeon]MBD3198438.1 hypothetical protein [Candidatus Lokiarchaeota archaeon]